MFLELLTNAPAIALVWILAIFISLTVHEFSHALVGKLRGDSTAEREGRLTLNPIAHLDPIGLIPLLLFGFGWAKPVPFNPYNLKNPKWDSVAIALAGPASNFVIAAASAFILRLVIGASVEITLLTVFLFLLVLLNLFLLFFNVIPVHPLDGSKLLFALLDAPKYERIRYWIMTRGPQVLLFAVIISLLTPIDVFGFIAAPAYATCDALVGNSCILLLSAIFS